MNASLELFQSIDDGDPAKASAILASEPSAASSRNERGVSALMWAIYRGQREIANAIRALHPGVDIFEATSLGDLLRTTELLDDDPSLARAYSPDHATALHFACFFRQPQIARLLINRGSDIEAVAVGFGGVTPLHSAAAASNGDAVEVLLRSGADPNARQQGGSVPLHSAANNGDAFSVRLLLDYRADPSLKTDTGQTAADIAAAKGHHEIVALIQSRLAAG